MPEILSSIPYPYRSSGASLLIAKANKLSELSRLESPALSAKARKSIRAGVAFYEMALILMKPYDPNYQTILNWRAHALIKLGEYKRAVGSWEEILKLSLETEGGHKWNATAQLAKEKIAVFSGKDDEIADDDTEGDLAIFDHPPFCMHAEEFCDLMAKGKFSKAHAYLSPKLRDNVAIASLRSSWLSLFDGEAYGFMDINLVEHLTDWPNRGATDIGWCYFTLGEGSVSEGISMVVSKNQNHGFEISSIEFGRP